MEQLGLLLELMLINMVLSGDNAIIIAMVSKRLPERERRIAAWWGAFGAVVLRIILSIVAVNVLQYPYIKTIGAVLLIWIAMKLISDADGHQDVQAPPKLSKVIWTIMTADLIMSIDNVLAVAAAAKGNVLMLVIGIAISIPIIVWGSKLIMELLEYIPALIYLGAGLLGFTAAEMFISDYAVIQMIPFAISSWLILIVGSLLPILLGLLFKKKI